MEGRHYDSAAAAYEEVATICAAHLGDAHPDTATARLGVSTALMHGGRHDDAIAVCEAGLRALGVGEGDAEDADTSLPSLISPVKFNLDVGSPGGVGITHFTSPQPASRTQSGTGSATVWSESDGSSASSAHMAPYLSDSDSGSDDAPTLEKAPKWSPLKTGNLVANTPGGYSLDSTAVFAEAGVLYASPTSHCDTFSCVDDARGAAIVALTSHFCVLLHRGHCPCSPCGDSDCYARGLAVCTRSFNVMGAGMSVSPDAGDAAALLGTWHAQHGKLSESVRSHRAAFSLRRRTLGDGDADTCESRVSLGVLAISMGARTAALKHLRLGVAGLRDEFGEADGDYGVAVWQLGRATAFAGAQTEDRDATDGASVADSVVSYAESARVGGQSGAFHNTAVPCSATNCVFARLPQCTFLLWSPTPHTHSYEAAEDALRHLRSAVAAITASWGSQHPFVLLATRDLAHTLAAVLLASPGAAAPSSLCAEADRVFRWVESLAAARGAEAGKLAVLQDLTGAEFPSPSSTPNVSELAVRIGLLRLHARVLAHVGRGGGEDLLRAAWALGQRECHAPALTPLCADVLEELVAVPKGASDAGFLLSTAASLRQVAVANSLLDSCARYASKGRHRAAGKRGAEALRLLGECLGEDHPRYIEAASIVQSAIKA